MSCLVLGNERNQERRGRPEADGRSSKRRTTEGPDRRTKTKENKAEKVAEADEDEQRRQPKEIEG